MLLYSAGIYISIVCPANMGHSTNAGSMLAHCLLRWAVIHPALAKHLVFLLGIIQPEIDRFRSIKRR